MTRTWRRCAGLLFLVASIVVAVLVGPPVANAATTTTSITVDGGKGGRPFDGVGAISGGGGNSRLLIDYPEPERSRILDYLFKPGYGAALQILKVEIGGDANSTDGAESSIEHAKGRIDCATGYEWWLMEQAKARDPGIKLYGLAWGAPGWIGNGDFWSTDMVDYLLSWLGCARSHGLTIDYLGGWNENGWVPSWFVQLRQALDAAGYAHVRLVASDNADWNVADDLTADTAFNRAVAVVGAHYPCGGDGSPAYSCSTTSTALALNKPLWASENGSQDDNAGAAAMIRSIVRGYVDAKLTAYINWPLVAAIPAGLPFETTGLMADNQPWSGSYSVGEQVWVAAHVTQFTRPGWSFVDSASGFLGGDRAGGSYMTLVSPDHRDYSTVIETTTATAVQTADVTVAGGLSTGPVHVWATNLDSADPADYFVHEQDVVPVHGRFSLTLRPGYVYSVTTTTGQGRGAAASPPSATFGLPYTDPISHTAHRVGSEPPYLADQDGAFEIQPCGGGRAGDCLQQTAPSVPIEWHQHAGTPYTVFGDASLTDYTVGADVLLTQPGSAEVLGHFEGRDYYQIGHIDAYYLRVDNLGNWSILKNDTSGDLTTLANGTVAALGLNTWHHIALTFQGSTITAAIDGKPAGSASDSSYPSGPAGLAVGVGDQATNVGANLLTQPAAALGWGGPYQLGVGQVAGTLTPTTTPTGTANGAGPVTGINGMCVDTGPIALDTCAGQAFTVGADGELQAAGGCVTESGSARGSALALASCTGGAAQIWTPQPDGTLVNAESGLCLDDPGFTTTPGTPLDVWTCNGGTNQVWTLPASDSAIGWQQGNAAANTWIQFTPTVQAGNSYAASITLQGTGDVYLDFYNGASDVTSSPVQLSATPRTVWVTTRIEGGNTPQLQVRTAAAGQVDLTASNPRLFQQAGDLGWLTDQFDNLALTPAGSAGSTGTAYEVVNRMTGQVMSATGQAVGTAPYAGGSNQQWHTAANPDTPGTLTVTNAGDGQVLTASRGVQLSAPAQAPDQRWRFQPDRSGDAYQIVNQDGWAVTATHRGDLALRPRHDGTDQLWQLLPVPYRDLAASFDNVGTTNDGNTNPGNGFLGFDGEGTTYSAQGLAAAGLTPGASLAVDGTTLDWPNVAPGQPDNTLALGQAIAVHGSGSRLTFVAASNNAAQSGTGTIYYTDGTTAAFTMDIGNFWFPAGQSGNPANTQVAAVNYANFPSGSSNHTVYVFAQSIPLDPTKTVAEVVLPELSTVAGYNAALHVFAIGVGR